MSKPIILLTGLCLAAAACSPAAQPSKTPDDTALLEPSTPVGQADENIKQGEAALQANDFQAAKKIFEAAIGKNPKHAMASYYLAVCLEGLGEKTEAQNRYRIALANEPNLSEASINLSNLLIEANKNDDAARVLQAAVARPPQSPELFAKLHMNLGYALATSPDKLDASIAAFQKALQITSVPNSSVPPEDTAAIRLALARQLIHAKKNAEASEQLRLALPLLQSNRDSLVELAKLALRAADHSNCIAAFDKAIAIKDSPDARVMRGMCRRSLKDNAGAREDFQTATKLDPRFPQGWFNLGELLASMSLNAEAIKAYETCVQIDATTEVGKRAAAKILELKKSTKR